jgi:hypothetical protein
MTGIRADSGLAVVVAGDVILDWSLARGQGDTAQTTCVSGQWGGAVLLGELIDAVAKQLPGDASSPIEVHAPEAPLGGVAPSDEHFNHRFTIWARAGNDGKKAWRVEKHLGEERATMVREQASEDAPERADLVVLYDSALGFREHPGMWPRAIGERDAHRPWILLRMAKPVAEGALWERLQPFTDRLIVVIHIDDLRLGAVHVTRELSWEQTAQDLLWELLYNPQVSGLAQCAYVVVSFTTAGALVLSRTADTQEEPASRLVFDQAFMERMWNETLPGAMIGGISALTASIARQVMLAPEHPDVILGVQRGIDAMRTLDAEGYAEQKRPSAEQERPSGKVRVVYPIDRIVDELCGCGRPLAEVQVRSPSRSRTVPGDLHVGRSWTILEERHPDNLERLATQIVLEGSESALADVPMGRFEDLVTFDRHEIEGLQSIRTLIRQYDSRKRSSKPPWALVVENEHESLERSPAPLSIAVFGPPGSGKSWSVKQVTSAVLPHDRVESKTFNLSQFDDPRELIDALHQVRDISLDGKLPLVFWDEFDTTRVTVGGQQKLGWLPHFLSPMQDGKFQDGQLTHPIGRAVFVFAGGVYERMHDFAEDSENFTVVKAPDFVSRLNGYVNIVGPNPRDGDAKDDPYYLIRRAVLLRSLLHQHAEGIFRDGGGKKPNIDDRVLHALLLTKEYRHGVRSLASIIATSAFGERDRFERSDLASEAQLDLHVDARDFLDLVHLSAIKG